jgi:hypothetical protein
MHTELNTFKKDVDKLLITIEGALFESQHEAISLAFQNAVTEVHVESNSVPAIIYDMEILTPDKSFEAQNKCNFS